MALFFLDELTLGVPWGNIVSALSGISFGAMILLLRKKKFGLAEAGFPQDERAAKLSTNKSAIPRIENHAEDIILFALDSFVTALGKELWLEAG